eukprot:jgi/Galph1/1369/GphlegSOOS_G5995.1
MLHKVLQSSASHLWKERQVLYNIPEILQSTATYQITKRNFYSSTFQPVRVAPVGLRKIPTSCFENGNLSLAKRKFFYSSAALFSSSNINDIASVATLAYGGLITAGGISAYVRTKSIPSIASSLVSAVLLYVAWQQKSPPLAFAVSCVLTGAFFMRFRKTRKLYPAGILGLISVCAACLFGFASFQT